VVNGAAHDMQKRAWRGFSVPHFEQTVTEKAYGSEWAATMVRLAGGGVGFDSLVPRHEDVARLRAQRRPTMPRIFDEVHDPARPANPHLELALEHTGRAELQPDHELPGLR
jgi:hypothetical protein